jgi:hypothetical protein
MQLIACWEKHMTTDAWLVALETFVVRAPSFVIGAAGFWLAFARRGRHPRVSVFGMVGFGALLIGALLFLGLQLWLQAAVTESGFRASEVFARWNLLAYPLNLVALAAITVAVFIDRGPAAGR